MTWQVVYEDQNLEVYFHDSPSDFLLVAFNPAGAPLPGMSAKDGRVWGAPVVAKLNCGGLGFMSKAANWFPAESVDKALEACAEQRAKFKKVVTYGCSMGAYGALKHARRIGATFTVAFSPQNPTRRANTRNTIEARNPKAYFGLDLSPDDLAGRSFIFHDPLETIDKGTVQDLLKADAQGLVVIETHATTHTSVQPFASTGMIEPVFRACIADDPKQLWKIWAFARRNNRMRPAAVAVQATAKHPAVAEKIFKKYRQVFNPEVAGEFMMQLVQGWAKKQDYEKANQTLEEAGKMIGAHPRLNNMYYEMRSLLAPHIKKT